MFLQILNQYSNKQTNKQNSLTKCRLTGGELVDQVIKGDNWTEGDAVVCVKQVLNILQHLHNLNIVHLDLKVMRAFRVFVCLF